jgi:hypothetical protein
MTRLGDVVARTQQYFKIANLGQLNEGLKYAVPVAKQYGISLEQVSTALGVLNTAGLEGSMAGTAFGAAMRQMIKASQDLGFTLVRTSDGGVDFIATIEAIKSKFGSFDEMTDETKLKLAKAFGDEGLRAISIFMGATSDMRKAHGELANAAGVTASAQKTMESTGRAALKILKNHVDDLKFSLASNLAPTISTIIETFKNVIATVKEFAQAHPDLMALGAKWLTLGAVVLGVVGPVLALTGSIMSFVGGGIKAVALIARLGFAFITAIPPAVSFAAALLANPITWIVLGVLALIGAIVALIVYWDKVVLAIKRAAGWLVQAFDTAWKWVKSLFTSAVGWLKENAVLIGIVLLGPIAWAVAAIIRYWQPIKGFFTNLWTSVKEVISNALSTALDFVISLPARFMEAGRALLTALWEGMKSVAGSVVDWFSSTLETIRSYLPFSDAEVGPLSDLTRSGQAFVETWATGMQQATPSLMGILNSLGSQAATATAAIPALAPLGEPLNVNLAVPRLEGGRQITIQSLTVYVQAQEAQEQEQFVDMLKGLAEQYG